MAEPSSILQHYPDYECTIGIEVHVQLNTKSKIFCTCSNQPVQDPNTNICQICCGYPGVLPMLNAQVVDSAILAGLATNCIITPVSEFARKHYFYPDLPKNFQVTQTDKPICTEGFIYIAMPDGNKKKIRIMRIHMEEDAGKNVHAGSNNESFVDLNRAGTPLLEIVTHPDISSTQEAKAYLKALRLIVVYLNIGTGNMQEGSFRADTNISVRKKGDPVLGTRVELKNINSFKFIGDAVEYEIERQIELLESGGQIRQETRLWDTHAHETKPMRSKEEAADYRYFEDPDLPLIIIEQDRIDSCKKIMPELPDARFERYCKQYGLSAYEAEIILEDPELCTYFEQAMQYSSSKGMVNWILRDIMGLIKEEKITLAQCKVTPEKLAQLVTLIDNGVINNRTAQEVFGVVAKTGKNPQEIVKEQGLEQIQSTDEIEKIIKEVLENSPQQLAAYKAGKEQMYGFFVGQVMKKTAGKANPQIIQEILKKLLAQ